MYISAIYALLSEPCTSGANFSRRFIFIIHITNLVVQPNRMFVPDDEVASTHGLQVIHAFLPVCVTESPIAGYTGKAESYMFYKVSYMTFMKAKFYV